MRDPDLWRPWFNTPSWLPWQSFLKALFCIPMNGDELKIYQQCTGRNHEPTDLLTEAWLCCGCRGGKSITLALIACYLAIFRDWTPYLTPGEVGYIKVLAVDRRQ